MLLQTNISIRKIFSAIYVYRL